MLRAELRSLVLPDAYPSADAINKILALPYLDACVRESLRLHAPATSTMRVFAPPTPAASSTLFSTLLSLFSPSEDMIPVSRPFLDKHGRKCDSIRVRSGDIITIPFGAMNRLAWADGGVFRPERWLERGGEEDSSGEDGRSGKGCVWGGIWTFGGVGSSTNGNRSCIGFRFALHEYVFH
jgi:cytochrome P450